MNAARWRLRPGSRKALLVAHIAAAGTWLGIDVVLGILVFTALFGGADTAAAAIVGAGMFATWPLAAAGLVCLGTGILLGLGSKYGLVRYWWVAVKLVLNVVLVTLVLLLLAPELGLLAVSARDALGNGRELPDLTGMVFPPVVSTTAVLFAMTVSTFKPWGRARK
jgi:hypothetical protein